MAAAAGKTADELARHARDTLKRLDPTGTQGRARAVIDPDNGRLLHRATSS